MTTNLIERRIFGVYVRVDQTLGWWFSLGFHIDLQHRSVDLHIFWWIITIGDPWKGRDGFNSYEEVSAHDEKARKEEHAYWAAVAKIVWGEDGES